MLRAAKRGDLNAVRSLLADDHQAWDSAVTALAAEHGHLEILEWAYNQGYPLHPCVVYFAASRGHLPVVEWALRRGCLLWDGDTTCGAAANGFIHVLEWGDDRRFHWHRDTLFWAAIHCHWRVIVWAVARGKSLTAKVESMITDEFALGEIRRARTKRFVDAIRGDLMRATMHPSRVDWWMDDDEKREIFRCQEKVGCES